MANSVVWPFLIRFALPFTVLTLGLGALVLNAAILLGAAWLLDDVQVEGLFEAVVVTLGLTLLTTLVGGVLALDRGDLWYRHIIRRQAKRSKLAEQTDVPGVVFLEIDGLAYDVLRRAMRDGNAPALARWVHDRGYQIARWETDWSSQTGACQAGLLHGNDHDMPAFRWWEKDTGKAIVTNHPKDAAEIERRQSNGRGPALRRRREPRQHPLRRRPALDAHHEHGARSRPAGAARAGLLRVLRQPLRRRAHGAARDRRDLHRALGGDPAGPP